MKVNSNFTRGTAGTGSVGDRTAVLLPDVADYRRGV